MATKWEFQAQPGFFGDLVELARQSPNKKLATQPGLALLSRENPSDGHIGSGEKDWERFAAHVKALNRDSPDNVSYKVLFLTRHGFGFHNKKHEEVGRIAWDVSVFFFYLVMR